MPWCPVCKNEYKEGYKVCADCGADLVDSLEDASEEIYEEFSEERISEDNISEVQEILQDPVALEELIKNRKYRPEYKPYVKAKDRAENYKSSAFALLLVGVLGIIFLILCLFGVVNISVGDGGMKLAFSVMLIMFLIFIFIGIRSFFLSKTIEALAEDEDDLTARVEDYFKSNYSAGKIDEIAILPEDVDLPDEMKYFKRNDAIKKILLEQFGDLDESYVDNETEVIFGLLYD